MKRFKSLAAIMLAVVMTFSVASCAPKKEDNASSSSNTETAKTPELVSTAKEKLTDIEDFKSTLEYLMVSSSEDQTVTNKVTVDVESIEDPYSMHMFRTVESDIGDGENISVSSDMYAHQVDDEKYEIFMELEDKWYKQTIDGASVAYVTASFKSLNVMKAIFNFAKDFKEVGTEQVNGKDAVKFDATLDKSSVASIVKAGNMLEYIQISDIDPSYYEGIESETVSVWIDKETNLPVKYSLNLANVDNNIFNILIDTLVNEQGANKEEIGTLNIDDFTVSAVLTDMDNVESVVIPDDVKNAEEFPVEEYMQNTTTAE